MPPNKILSWSLLSPAQAEKINLQKPKNLLSSRPMAAESKPAEGKITLSYFTLDETGAIISCPHGQPAWTMRNNKDNGFNSCFD
jgi:hypothetical protein